MVHEKNYLLKTLSCHTTQVFKINKVKSCNIRESKSKEEKIFQSFVNTGFLGKLFLLIYGTFHKFCFSGIRVSEGKICLVLLHLIIKITC